MGYPFRPRPLAVALFALVLTGCGSGGGTDNPKTITAPPVAVLTTVSVSLPSPTIEVGRTVTASAAGFDQNGAAIGIGTVTWSTGSPTIATVSGAGVVTAVAPGLVSINATVNGRTGAASLTVIPVPVATVSLTPATVSLIIGVTQQLSVAILDGGGNALSGRAVTWGSSNPAVGTVSSTGVVTGVAVGTTVITATSEGKSATATITVSNVPVAAVSVSPATASLTIGGTQQLTASARGAAGAPLTGRAVTWSTTNAAVATISATGLVTAVASGSATLTATVEGIQGTATVTVVALPGAITGLTVAPSSAALTVGQTQALTPTVTQPAGAPGAAVTYGTTAPSVATVSTAGVVTAVAAGTATITVTATAGGNAGFAAATVSQQVPVTVTVAPVASVVVSPSTLGLVVGGSQPLTASARDAAGAPLTGRAVTWSTTNAAVATISATGLVTAVASGSATLTATVEGIQGTATVTVVAPAPAITALAVSPSAAQLAVGSSIRMVPSVNRASASVTVVYTYTSSTAAVATVSDAGMVTAVAPGTTTITVSAAGTGTGFAAASVTAAATVTVVALPEAITGLQVSPSSAALTVGQTQALTPTVTQPAGAPGAAVTYGTTAPSVATVSTAGVVTAVAPGAATITVTATAGGNAGFAAATVSQQVPVTVTVAPVASVVVSPSTLGLVVGGSQPLTASARDAAGAPLTGRAVTWSSSATSVASVSTTGVVTAVAPGSATITATVEGINATAAITVANVPVAAVSVSPVSAVLPTGGTQQLTAAARSAAGAALTGRIVTWSSSAPGVANVSASGLVTAVTTGSATITATVEGIQGTATMTVSSNVLTLGQTVTGLSSSAGDLLYNVAVPAGTSSLTIRTSGGSGTVRLLVYQGASAAGSAVCSSSNSTSTSQVCAVNAPAAGTWTIRVQEYVSAFTGVTLEVNPSISTLSLGQTITGRSSSVGDALYNVAVPAGTSSLTIRTSGGSGTVRLLVYQGASAAGSAVCSSSNSTSTSQVCAVNAPAAGTWTIRIQEYVSAFTGVTLEVNPSISTLSLGQTVTGLSSSVGDALYNVAVPAGTSSLTIRTSGGSGTVRLLVYQGASAAGSAVCSSSNSTSTSQVCAVNAPAAGTWTIRVQEYVSAFTGVTLAVSTP